MSDPAQTTWPGAYFDGQSAGRKKASVRISSSGLRLVLEDGRELSWPFEEVRQEQGAAAGEHVRLERLKPGETLPEALVIRDPAFLLAVREIAPHARLRAQLAGGRFWALVAGSAVATVAAAIGIYGWGVPMLADLGAALVPVSAEEKLGQLVVSQMGGVPEKELLAKDPATYHALDAIVQTMAKAHPSPYTFRVTVAETEDVNAFAAPGGYVVVNRGLLKRTRRPEELAGVLAHEMQHVYQRHATRNLFRQLGIQAILTALTGDAGTLGTAVGMAGQFGGLSYQRRDEAEADAEGMKLVLAAKLDPKGMIAAYEMLDRDAPDVPEGLGFLSTHPGTKERIASLRGLAADARYEPMPLLPDLPWKQIVGAGGH